MLTVRRLYLYLAAFISLIALLNGLTSLIQGLLNLWFPETGLVVGAGSFARSQIAFSAGLLLAAVPLHWLHWGIANHLARVQTPAAAAERAAAVRKAYLYSGRVAALVVVVVNLAQLLTEIAQLALGRPLVPGARWPAEPLTWLAGIGVGGLVWAYLRAQTRADNDDLREAGRAASWRRTYVYGIALLSALGLLLSASGILATLLLQALPTTSLTVGGGAWRTELAGHVTWLLISLFFWRSAWLTTGTWLASPQAEGEAQAVSRKIALYGGVLLSAGATLTAASLVLRRLLQVLLGAPDPFDDVWRTLATPLGYIPAGAVLWAWHWRRLQAGAARSAETPEQALIRRLYYYLVAAIGLGLTWYGLTDLLRLALETTLGSPRDAGLDVAAAATRDRLSLGLAVLLSGAPVWLAHWRTMQALAAPADRAAAAERRAVLRKIYLYGVSLVAAVLILFNVATVAYRLINLALGDTAAFDFVTEISQAAAISGIAALFWGFHALALRRDNAAVPSPADERSALEADLARLRQQVSDVERRLAELG